MTMTDRLERQDSQRSYSSRDYSEGRATRARSSVATSGVGTQTKRHTPTLPRRRGRVLPQRQLGSKQSIVSRGRRLTANIKKADPHKVRFLCALTAVLVAGIFGAMLLSGWATTQTYQLNKLQYQETTLDNQIETLNRDLQSASASAELARKAGETKMVVPEQPGVLVKNNKGDTVEQRPAGDVTRPIVDVNGQRVRASGASTDPERTDEVQGNLREVPQHGVPASPGGYVSAPYQDNSSSSQGGNE